MLYKKMNNTVDIGDIMPAPNGWVIYIASIIGYIIAKILFD